MRKPPIPFSVSKLSMIFLLSFLGGVFLSSFVFISPFLIYELGGLAVFFLFLSFHQKKNLLAFFLFLGLLVGIGRWGMAENQVIKNPLRPYLGKEVSVQGWVCQEPQSATRQKITLCLSSLSSAGTSRKIPRPIFLETDLSPTYHYGERLKAVGVLQSSQEERIIALIDHPYLQVLKGEKGFWLKRLALQSKQKLKGIINQSFSYQEAAFLKALFLGDRSDLSFSLKKQLAAIGLIHVIAISGLHLIILISLLLVLAEHLPFPRSWVIGLTLIFLWLFVFLVGGRPSILRAAIMASFLLVGELAHRSAFHLRSLILAADVLLLMNPFSLRFDLGFQLSFLAVLGIIWLKPFIEQRKPSLLMDLIETSLTAQILVWPLLLYHFGQASIISPLSNLFVTPFLPLLFGLGFPIFLLEFCFPSLLLVGQIFLTPLTWYFLKVVQIFSSFPHIVLAYSLPGWGLALIYLPFLIFFFLTMLSVFFRKRKEASLLT